MSFARKYRQARLAELAAGGGQTVAASGRSSSNIVDVMAGLLASHTATLKSIDSHITRAARKQAFMPDFAAYVDGVLKADSGGADPILPTIFIWAGDIGDWPRFLAIGGYLVRHGLVMPDQWTRAPASVLVETIADAYSQDQKADLLAHLAEAMAITEGVDMADQVRAKAYKALADAEEDPAAKVSLLEKAQQYGGSVKTALAAARKAADKAIPDQDSAPTNTPAESKAGD